MSLDKLTTDMDKKCLLITYKWLHCINNLEMQKKMSYKEYLDSIDSELLKEEIFKHAKFEN